MYAEPTPEQRTMMSEEEIDVRGAMELLGFNDEDTGGGVRCWITPGDEEAVQSDETDGTPTRWGEPVRYWCADTETETKWPSLACWYREYTTDMNKALI